MQTHDVNEREGLVATATVSRKPVNQDACATVSNPVCGLRGVIVADGLGSQYGAEIASAFAAAHLRDYLEAVATPESLDLVSLFRRVRQDLEEHVATIKPTVPPDVDLRNAFGTTLLCGIDTPGSLIAAYTGNGAILHIRGNFNDFPTSQLVPWSAVNYCNPHASSARGRNVLYKFIAPTGTDAQTVPTVVQVAKDPFFFGDLLIVASDGIASIDQTPIGTDDDQRIWVSAEPSLSLLYGHLSTFFASKSQPASSLEAALAEYLVSLNGKNLVTDDCTLGLVVSAAARRYQRVRTANAADALVTP